MASEGLESSLTTREGDEIAPFEQRAPPALQSVITDSSVPNDHPSTVCQFRLRACGRPSICTPAVPLPSFCAGEQGQFAFFA